MSMIRVQLSPLGSKCVINLSANRPRDRGDSLGTSPSLAMRAKVLH